MQMKPNTLRNKRNPRWSRCVHTRNRHAEVYVGIETHLDIWNRNPAFGGSIPVRFHHFAVLTAGQIHAVISPLSNIFSQFQKFHANEAQYAQKQVQSTLGSVDTHPHSTWSEVYVGIETQLLGFHWDRNPWTPKWLGFDPLGLGVSIPVHGEGSIPQQSGSTTFRHLQ